MLIQKTVMTDCKVVTLESLPVGAIFVFADGQDIGDMLLAKSGEAPGIWRKVRRQKGDSSGVDIISIDCKGGLNNRQSERSVVQLSNAECSLLWEYDGKDHCTLGDLAAGDILRCNKSYQVVDIGPKTTGKVAAICLDDEGCGELSTDWDADRVTEVIRGDAVRLTINLKLG